MSGESFLILLSNMRLRLYDPRARLMRRGELRWSRHESATKEFVAFDDSPYPGMPIARIRKDGAGLWLWRMTVLEEGVLRCDGCTGKAATKQDAKAEAAACYFRARLDWLEQRSPWPLT